MVLAAAVAATLAVPVRGMAQDRCAGAADLHLVNGRIHTMDAPGQLLTRQEALRVYTAKNGCFTHEEKTLGTIEAGKLGDLVLLSGDSSTRGRCLTKGSRR